MGDPKHMTHDLQRDFTLAAARIQADRVAAVKLAVFDLHRHWISDSEAEMLAVYLGDREQARELIERIEDHDQAEAENDELRTDV